MSRYVSLLTSCQWGLAAKNSLGNCPHWRKVIGNWINAGILLCFVKREFDAGFLTTEITETGSLGARRTLKGWEGCLRIK